MTYTKLKDGSWGIRGTTSEIRAGSTVTVVKKSGERKTETVGKVLWTGDGIALATVGGASSRGMCTERQADAGYARGRQVRSDCCGYPCPVSGRRCTPSDPCHDCQ